MPTFFSTTDTATLKEEGRDRNNFVSLIVNNAGSYTAAITRKLKNKSVKESISYEFFGDGEKHDTKEFVSNDTEIEWFYLNIVNEGDTVVLQDMDARFEEIKKRKAEEKKNAEMDRNSTSQVISYNKGFYDIKSEPTITTPKKNFVPTSLFDGIDDWGYNNHDIPYGTVKFDESTIKQLTLQLITGSIIIPNDSKIDIKKWATSMPTMYQKRFGKGEDGMKLFELWADMYTEFITWYAIDEELESLGMDDAEICATCAHDIIEELKKLPENEYIKGYIEALKKYLVI